MRRLAEEIPAENDEKGLEDDQRADRAVLGGEPSPADQAQLNAQRAARADSSQSSRAQGRTHVSAAAGRRFL